MDTYGTIILLEKWEKCTQYLFLKWPEYDYVITFMFQKCPKYGYVIQVKTKI